VDSAAVERLIAPKAQVVQTKPAQTLDDVISRRAEFLTGYQNAAYAERYRALVDRVRQAEGAAVRGQSALAEAVARYYFKLLAYKDEYEVARLYADPAFMEKVRAQFDGDYKLRFHLAPPLLARRDPVTGELRKAEYGGWVYTAFRVLARLRGLRGTALDIFGYTAERRMERRLITEYEVAIAEILDVLSPDNHALAVKIASLPEEIRGYGHVKEANVRKAKAVGADLLAALRSPEKVRSAA
jgi:indolepyruvate ferredoxin oxidoreductase